MCDWPVSGAGHLSPDASTIGHTVADLIAKQGWGVLEYMMENKLHRLNEEAEEEEDDEIDPDLLVRPP